jgi:hypothetical protein
MTNLGTAYTFRSFPLQRLMFRGSVSIGPIEILRYTSNLEASYRNELHRNTCVRHTATL